MAELTGDQVVEFARRLSAMVVALLAQRGGSAYIPSPIWVWAQGEIEALTVGVEGEDADGGRLLRLVDADAQPVVIAQAESMSVGGYEAEPTDADAVWEALIGERDMDDDMEWWTHLSSRGALLAEVTRRIHDERARIAARWNRDGDSYAVIGDRIGLTRARAQQLVERGRAALAAD